MADKATVPAEKKVAKMVKKPFFAAPAPVRIAPDRPARKQEAGRILPFPLQSISEISRKPAAPAAKAPVAPASRPVTVKAKPAPAPASKKKPAPKAIAPGNAPVKPADLPEKLDAKPGATADIPRSPQKPGDDPAFKSLQTEVRKKAFTQKKHGETTEKLHAGKIGAVAPKGESLAHAQGAVVEDMSQTKVRPKMFDRNEFLRQFDKQIKDSLPKSKGEMERFAGTKEPNEPAEVKALKGSVTAGVKQAQTDATQPLADASRIAPNPNAVVAPEFKPLEKEKAGAAPVVQNAAQAAPKAKTDGEISMEKEAASLDTQMQEGEVSPEQLQNSNEPKFIAANDSKMSAQEKARQAPDAYRAAETPLLDNAQTQADAGIAGQMNVMNRLRGGLFGGVDKGKGAVKTRNELMRERVRKQLEDVYTQTKSSVDSQLANLEKAVTDQFVADLARATQTFKKNVDRKIDDLGITDSISDFFTGSDSKQEVFDAEKTRFEADLRTTINTIADKVETGLNAAMRTIREGREKVDSEVAKMSPEEKKIADEIKGEIDDKFGALEDSVQEKQGALAESLSKKYIDGVAELNAIFEKIKEEHMGWLEKAARAIKGVIVAIANLKDMLFDVLAKAKSVIMSIVKDPIRFIRNLVTAVKMGLNNFKKNIWEHLKQGFFAWLLGAMPPGIEIPKDFDLLSIFKFVASFLGLTWANIRSRAVKKIGEPVVNAMENTFDVFMVIIREGIGGLWRLIKEKFNNLKEMVIDAVLNFLKEKVIMAGVMWIIGLMNPAGAFIKACKAIYDIVKFFIERGKQIMEFVNSVLDSIAEIVAGKLGPAAQRVEDSLAKAIPVAIGFLASLLGLGGLSEKVIAIIQKIQAPVNRAIDWILDKAIAFAKKLGVDKLVGKVKEGVNKGKDWVKDKAEKGQEKLKAAAGKFLGWLKIKKGFTDKSGEKHTVYFEGKDENADLMVASRPRLAKNLIKEIGSTPDGKKVYAQILEKINQVGALKLKITNLNDEAGIKVIEAKIKALVGDIGALFATVSIKERLATMKLVALKFDKVFTGLDKEYDRQLVEQQTALSGMTIAKWLTNRSVFENKGRIPDSYLRQQVNDDFRKKAEFRTSMEKRGVKDEKEINKLWKYQQAATHGLDQVAGGDHHVFTDVGVGAVNSHIGTQWKSKIETLTTGVGEVNPAVYAEEKMKVKLSAS